MTGVKGNEDAIRIVKKATCKSLSGKSKLTYHIGCDASSVIHVQLAANSASGYFNDDWVPLHTICDLLSSQPKGTPLTSFLLYPLYSGKSYNSPSFLMAVLFAEGIVKASEERRRCFDLVDTKAFLDSLQAHLAGNEVKGASSKASTKGKRKPLAKLGTAEGNAPGSEAQ